MKVVSPRKETLAPLAIKKLLEKSHRSVIFCKIKELIFSSYESTYRNVEIAEIHLWIVKVASYAK